MSVPTAINTAASSTTILAPPTVSARAIRIFDFFLVAAANATITIKDTNGTSYTGPITMIAGTPIHFPNHPDEPFDLQPGYGLVIAQTGTTQLSGYVSNYVV